jgi:hypothetical protein
MYLQFKDGLVDINEFGSSGLRGYPILAGVIILFFT